MQMATCVFFLQRGTQTIACQSKKWLGLDNPAVSGSFAAKSYKQEKEVRQEEDILREELIGDNLELAGQSVDSVSDSSVPVSVDQVNEDSWNCT